MSTDTDTAEAEALRAEVEDLREALVLLEAVRDDYIEVHDLAPVALLTLANDGTIRSANLAAAELFEIERGALVYRQLHGFVHEQDHRRVTEYLGQRGRGLRRGCDIRLVFANSRAVPVQLWARASWRRLGVQHLTLLDMRERELDAWEKEQLVEVARRTRSASGTLERPSRLGTDELRVPKRHHM